jgi:hypothetical protein
MDISLNIDLNGRLTTTVDSKQKSMFCVCELVKARPYNKKVDVAGL